MRILSLRLIVALIVGVTLVSLASSWYEVQAEKEALRRDLERKAEIFGESLAGNAESFLQSGARPGLERMVQRFNNRDRCDSPLMWAEMSSRVPDEVSCPAHQARSETHLCKACNVESCPEPEPVR
jgi:hypothetical protein